AFRYVTTVGPALDFTVVVLFVKQKTAYEIRGVLNEDDAGVGWGRVARTVRNVVDAEQKTSDDLDRDENHCHTAEIAIGGGRVVRNPTVELCVDRIGKLEARVEPIDDGGLQSHRG